MTEAEIRDAIIHGFGVLGATVPEAVTENLAADNARCVFDAMLAAGEITPVEDLPGFFVLAAREDG